MSKEDIKKNDQNYYDHLDQSEHDESHFDLHRVESLLQEYKDNRDKWNKEERTKELDIIEEEIKKQKMLVKDRVKPDNIPEKERLSNISEKVTDQVFGIFEHTDNFDEAEKFLESYYQRGKVDMTYGRAFILVCEDSLLSKAKDEYGDNEENEKLIDFISKKNIELAKEVMSDDYVHLLKDEREFLLILMKNNKLNLL
ncbi:hypothetical protein [Staphylococcus debuckii]|uniref:hypothetical protein n=1 Tax=Staphylococcus debuckii TaxID=2044912 RepID=UPI000F43208B|nr:hypothetical protein [Staphylococcus debuckii]AYU54066.1 hypothetical protein CNQ82_00870 [Staphylococcus debuckii]